MEAEARSVNDIPRRHAPLSTKKKFTVAQRAFLLLLLLEARWWVGWARRIEFYFHSGESGVEPHTGFPPAAEEHELIRRTAVFLILIPLLPITSSQTISFPRTISFWWNLETSLVLLSSFPYRFTDQVSKRYDSSLPLPLPLFTCTRLFHFISLLPLFFSFFSFSALSCLFPSFVFVYEHNRLCIKRANRNKPFLFITALYPSPRLLYQPCEV